MTIRSQSRSTTSTEQPCNSSLFGNETHNRPIVAISGKCGFAPTMDRRIFFLVADLDICPITL